MKTTTKTALITGATGGIGQAFCRLFAQDHINLVLLSRNREKLQQLRDNLQAEFGISVHLIILDLTRPDAAHSVLQQLKSQGLQIDYLVNNAGMGQYGLFQQADYQQLSKMLTLNIGILLQLTRLLLPEMLQRGGGKILNTASLVAFQPGGANAAAYYASKSFVLAFNRALTQELQSTPVTTMAFCPGPLNTDFARQGAFGATRLYRYFSGNLNQQVQSAYKAFFKGKSTCVPGWSNKLLALGGELPPRGIALEINRYLLQTTGGLI